MTIDVRRAAGRAATRDEERTTFHSFSFGAYYDPENVGFAAMTAHNDENLPPGGGFAPHPHRDLEIVTWVISGALRHTDSTGHTAVLGPGEVLRTSAGSGIVHSELAEPGTATRFLQTWLRPDTPGGEPSYASSDGVEPTGLEPVVGTGSGLALGTTGARLHLAAPAARTDLILPDAPRLHVFVAEGEVRFGELVLSAGDAARLVGEGGRELVAESGARISAWAFDA